MGRVEYRRPKLSHVEDLYVLEKLCFPSPWDIDELKGLLAEALTLYTLGAFLDGTPIGYISAAFSEPGVLHIISICVHPDHRRRGVAGDLLSCAFQWGRHLEADRVILEVREGNSSAMEFYRKYGFRQADILENFYGNGINGIFMERDTDPVDGALDTILFLNSRLNVTPRTGVILGSGLGWVTEPFGTGVTIPFADIPGMAGSSVKGHAHKLVTSSDGRTIFIMGRRHHYQGYNGREIVLLPSALASLGVDRWLLTSSSGALDPEYRVGDAMIFTDHINFSGCIPDPPLKAVGSNIYSDTLCKLAEGSLKAPRKGVFTCVSGPAYETAAEVDLLRRSGGSAVSMSTAQEAMALRSLGCSVVALSLITNSTDSGDSVCHEEVLSAQEVLRQRQESGLIDLVGRLGDELPGS